MPFLMLEGVFAIDQDESRNIHSRHQHLFG
jgi:hypothetical protein